MSDNNCDKSRDTRRLYVPKNKLNLPFFAYDVFKPGEIAYSRIEYLIDKNKSIRYYHVEYPLDIINGVPFLFKEHNQYYCTNGSLFYFKNYESAAKAYVVK